MNKIFIVLCFLFFQNSFAALTDSFGIGTRNIFLGGAADLTDGGAYASKGNPASLTKIKKTLMDTSIQVNSPNLEDTKLVLSDPAASGLTQDTYSASNASNMNGLTFGMTLPLGSRISFGVSGAMPAGSLAKVYAYSGKESNYLHYMDRQARPEIYTGLGIKLWEPLSIGLGAFFSIKADGTIQSAMSDTDQENRMLLDLKPILVPYAGILWTQNLAKDEELIIGATYRAEHNAKAELKVDIRMGVGSIGMIPVQAESQLLAFYDPAKISMGLGFKNKKIGTYFGLENIQYSKFKANIMQMNNGIFDGLENGELSRNPIVLQDSWTVRTGFELKEWIPIFNGNVNSQIGFEYQTSALPSDPISLAMLDTDKTVVNFGSGFRFPKIEGIVKMPLTFNLGFKWTHLFDESYTVVNSAGGISSAQIGGEVFSFITGVVVEI
ncbi:MAG: hypothetical protein DRQ88_01665 [Epsilonproteobacteria bacterium]|nr:MAG: hypothetical protein DRQ89_06390 [Campylobacterota bacterium]RLA67784.1 MAG: hypothetical protein DRQ88_01665 [Campylobacterota bacterium]